MSKILELCSQLNIGGAQAVAAAIGLHAPQGIRVDYLVFSDREGDYEADLTARGCRIHHWPAPSGGQLRYLRKLTALLRRERYDAVHCHNMFSAGTVMLAGFLAGVPCRIAHSHTTREECADTISRRFYRWVMRRLIHLFGTEFFACGVAAGNTLYGEGWFAKHGTLIPNGIDTAAYGFSPNVRKAIREACGLRDAFVIGHVGHYVGVKNQSFLIDLMPRLLELRPDAVLLLFGEGQDRAMLTQRIQALNLTDRVRLMGNVRNIGQILSAFDVFAFPSLFEGTPLALLEAQANGLCCIISDSIPTDAIVTDDVHPLPLDADLWLPALASARRTGTEDQSHILLQKYESIHDSMTRIYTVVNQYQKDR